MTYQEYISQTIASLTEETVTVEELQKAATTANSNLEIDEAVIDGILAALEVRMDEADFVEFCETL